jgi:hemoglobin-like flavoprotein
MAFLRSLNDAFYRSPDLEGGADGGEVSDTDVLDDGGVGEHSGSDDGDSGDSGQETSGEKLSVRDQIKKSFAEANEAAQPKPTKKSKGRAGDGQQQAQPSPEPVAAQNAGPALNPPDSLNKDAKAAWAQAPRALQEAFIKREQDMQKGVDELKGKYAQIDNALAEHTDALRQMNASPGEAVSRMFLWFKALANNPVAAFPGLAQSFGMDWSKIVQAAQAQAGQQPGQQQGQQGNNGQAAPAVPEEMKQYVSGLENQVRQLSGVVQQIQQGYGTIQQDMNAANEAKTRENLSFWSKDKKYFEEVRQDMARLIQADPALVKNGQVDLDTAYERAIFYNPEVRAKVLAEQQQANQQVQQQTTDAATTAKAGQVAKARKASVSIPSSNAPNTEGAPRKKAPAQRGSVRDSLKAAIAELRDQ